VWDARDGSLLHVDIAAGRVCRWRPGSGRQDALDFGVPVSFVLPRATGGYVVGANRDVLLLDGFSYRQAQTMASVEADRPNNRFNDAKCDAAGRLWAGTKAMDDEARAGALYRIDPTGDVVAVATETTISNGLGWSPGGNRFYFIDSPTGRIDEFDFDLEAGVIANRRNLVEIDPALGFPDGLAVDAKGGIWVALFGGGAVHRYLPDGTLDAKIELPTANPTSVAFGAPDLTLLYTTTARIELSPEELAAQPLAGSVFVAEPGVRGMPVNAFVA
jgi:sugar lactone lactonase YvrE